jgi:carbon storage regulator
MLVLTRKTGESINIGDSILVTVVSVENGQVKLGIEAPGGVKIFRTELYEQIQRQNKSAAGPDRRSVAGAAKLRKKKRPG